MNEKSSINNFIDTAKSLLKTKNKDDIYSVALRLLENEKEKEMELLEVSLKKEKEMELQEQKLKRDLKIKESYYLKQISYSTQR